MQPATCHLPPATCNLSIIIVNWNTRDLLAQCLESVYSEPLPVISQRSLITDLQSPITDHQSPITDHQSPITDHQSPITDHRSPFTEVFVVDNASTDGSVAMMHERFPWVQLIENAENVGFARANNQAIELSLGRYVLLLNSDTTVHAGALDTLVAFMEAHPNCGAAGARLLNADGSLQPSVQPMLTPGREFWRLSFLEQLWPKATYPLADWDVETPHQVEVIKGACLLLRRDALDQVGRLDNQYFMYTEEVDLCYRLAQAGWSLWYVPAAVVTHFGEASSRQVAERMYLQLYRSKMQFFRKFGGESRARQAKVLFTLAYAPRAAIASMVSLIRPDLQSKARVYRRLLAELPGM